MIFHFIIYLLVASFIANRTYEANYFLQNHIFFIDEEFSSTLPIKTSHDKETTVADIHNNSFTVSLKLYGNVFYKYFFLF